MGLIGGSRLLLSFLESASGSFFCGKKKRYGARCGIRGDFFLAF